MTDKPLGEHRVCTCRRCSTKIRNH